MKAQDFDYSLPDELIARYPLENRSDSRLMVVDRARGTLTHKRFRDIVEYLQPEDLLVFNNSRVIPARLFGQKATGGKVEILIERVRDQFSVLAHVRSSKSPKPGTEIIIAEDAVLRMQAREGDLFILNVKGPDSIWQLLEQHGHMPLPPYMQREDTEFDRERYQTVYAKPPGSVAAPTAGLHFDAPLLSALETKGVARGFVTLHVGAGTFQPVRTENIEDHIMHKEYLEVDADLCHKVQAAKARKGRVVAVGTTSVRCMETASSSGIITSYSGDTQIFIYPGYTFKTVDTLITNFHLPQSTLLMLVSALAGKELIMHAYQEAIRERYRFYSYGDAMLII